MTRIVHDVFNEMEFDLYQLKVLKDNFSYVVSANGEAVVVDPSSAEEIRSVLDENHLKLKACLITHYHPDHHRGVTPLTKERDCQVIGPSHPQLENIIDQDATDGDELIIGPFTVQVMASPGHTLDHLFYYFPDCSLLFTGDTLFLSGCGKMFEGDEWQYFQSLQRIKALPLNTRILCGHDYVEENNAFIKGLNPSVQLDDTITFRTLEDELKVNPFLQAKTPEEFLKLRKLRDSFRL